MIPNVFKVDLSNNKDGIQSINSKRLAQGVSKIKMILEVNQIVFYVKDGQMFCFVLFFYKGTDSEYFMSYVPCSIYSVIAQK